MVWLTFQILQAVIGQLSAEMQRQMLVACVV
jgi:hypothetical protein